MLGYVRGKNKFVDICQLEHWGNIRRWAGDWQFALALARLHRMNKILYLPAVNLHLLDYNEVYTVTIPNAYGRYTHTHTHTCK